MDSPARLASSSGRCQALSPSARKGTIGMMRGPIDRPLRQPPWVARNSNSMAISAAIQGAAAQRRARAKQHADGADRQNRREDKEPELEREKRCAEPVELRDAHPKEADPVQVLVGCVFLKSCSLSSWRSRTSGLAPNRSQRSARARRRRRMRNGERCVPCLRR